MLVLEKYLTNRVIYDSLGRDSSTTLYPERHGRRAAPSPQARRDPSFPLSSPPAQMRILHPRRFCGTFGRSDVETFRRVFPRFRLPTYRLSPFSNSFRINTRKSATQTRPNYL